MINFDEDVWLVPSENVSYIKFYKFDFSSIKQKKFKNEIKIVISEILKRGLLKEPSAHRYYSAILHAFIPFLEENQIEINYFSEISEVIIERYIFYLKSRSNYSPNSNSLALAGLNSIINMGIYLNLANYPNFSPVPEKTSRIFGIDDVLKSRYIPDEEVDIILNALEGEEDIYLKAFIIISIYNGLRISEILTLRNDCLLNDLLGYKILFAYDIKTEKERYVIIEKEVHQAINVLINAYVENKNKYIFFNYNNNGKVGQITQQQIRYKLNNFYDKHNLKHYSPHSYRHTVGTRILNNGGSISQIQETLGHDCPHSSNGYAKMKDGTLDREYYAMPILGFQPKSVVCEKKTFAETAFPLPDGMCKNVNKDGKLCSSSYKCLFCNMFITFKEDLITHKSHLERIKENAENYMHEEGINSFELLNDVENALEIIIERIENYGYNSKGNK